MDHYIPLPDDISGPESLKPIELYRQGCLASEIFSRACSYIQDVLQPDSQAYSIKCYQDTYNVDHSVSCCSGLHLTTNKIIDQLDMVTHTSIYHYGGNNIWTVDSWQSKRLETPIFVFDNFEEFIWHGTIPCGLSEHEFRYPNVFAVGLHMLGHHDAAIEVLNLEVIDKGLVSYCDF